MQPRTYIKGDKVLEISELSGEYTNGTSYLLKDTNENVFKERKFFHYRIGNNQDSLYIEEKVTNHIMNPSKSFIRIQKIPGRRYNLKTIPLMANRKWQDIKE